MEITEVRVMLMEEPGERLQAFCSITLDDAFVIRDLKIIEGATGPFVAMPSRKLTGHCPQCWCKNHLRAAFCNQCGAPQEEQRAAKDDAGRVKLYADIAHPINSACRELIQQRVIQAYCEEKARSQLPGYAPTCEEFDDDPWAPPASTHVEDPRVLAAKSQAAKSHAAKIETAQGPRGPHRPPAAAEPSPRASATRVDDGFGAGIFE